MKVDNSIKDNWDKFINLNIEPLCSNIWLSWYLYYPKPSKLPASSRAVVAADAASSSPPGYWIVYSK